ncbi:unnamed protein product, partial [Allacma fusca]
METQFEEHKEAISNALGKLSIVNEGSWVQLRIWGEWYLQWNWKFTANHFFNVNNSTVPAVIGTILTICNHRLISLLADYCLKNLTLVTSGATLAEKLTHYCGTLAFWNSLFHRIIAVVYCQSTLELIQILDSLSRKINGIKRSEGVVYKSKIQFRWIIFVYLMGVSIFIISVDQLVILPVFSAFTLVLLAGCVLTRIQDDLSSIIVSSLEKLQFGRVPQQQKNSLQRQILVQTVVKDDLEISTNLSEFPEIFEQLQRAFNIYSVLAGWNILIALFDVGWLAFGVYQILVLAMFGEFMASKVEKCKERVSDALGMLNLEREA